MTTVKTKHAPAAKTQNSKNQEEIKTDEVSSDNKKKTSDEITDPNFLTYLSSCIKEVHIQENPDIKTFAQRLKDSEALRAQLPSNEKQEIDTFIKNMENVEDVADLHSSLGSIAGFKSLLKIKTAEQLYAYCSILNLNRADFDYIFNNPNSPPTALSKLSLVMALGIWYRAMQELESKGVSLKDEVKIMMKMVYEKIGGNNAEGTPKSDSFESGLNFSRRLLSGVHVERKRGRRPKNYFSQYDEKLNDGSVSPDSQGLTETI